MYNAAHILATRVEDGTVDLTLATARPRRQSGSRPKAAKVDSDASTAIGQLRRLWVQRVEAEGTEVSEIFVVAHQADQAGDTTAAAEEEGVESARVTVWRRAAMHWAEFEAAFARQPSSQNEGAIEAMRAAMVLFASLLHTERSASTAATSCSRSSSKAPRCSRVMTPASRVRSSGTTR